MANTKRSKMAKKLQRKRRRRNIIRRGTKYAYVRSVKESTPHTSGTNLTDIYCHESVDPENTISNDINEIYELLGIEAARQALFNEISGVLKDADGLYVNYRHLALLVDTMTNRGYLLSINRHGINRVDIGPLAKSSFEESDYMLIKAGIFAEIDKINGVSSNIMLGQIPPSGTGDTEVLIDLEKLYTEKDIPEEIEEIEDQPEQDTNTICEYELDFDLPAPDTNTNIKFDNIDIKIV